MLREGTTVGQLVFGLHAVNGLTILTVAGTIGRQAGGAVEARGKG